MGGVMDEIKPVAWAFGQDWSQFQADRQECRLLPNFYWGEDLSLSSDYAALYDQQAIDTLREQVNRLFLSGREWATRFGEQEARAERAEAEVERLKEVCDKWSERELLFGAHEDLQARAERAEAEAQALRVQLSNLMSRVVDAHTGDNEDGCGMSDAEIAAIDAAKQDAE